MDNKKIFNELHGQLVILLCALMSVLSIMIEIKHGGGHRGVQAVIWFCTALILSKLEK